MKKKNKKILLLFSITSLFPLGSGVFFYFTNPDFKTENPFLNLHDELSTKENLDFSNAISSITDFNLKELKIEEKPKINFPKKPKENIIKPPLEKPKPIETPKIIETSKPIPSPKPIEKPKPIEIPKPIPSPKPIEKPKSIPPAEKPINKKPLLDKKQKFSYFGIEIEILDSVPLKPRTEFQSDKDAGITNREPYLNHTLPEIKRIKVTKELLEKTGENAKNILQKSLLNITGGTPNLLTLPDTERFKLKEYLRQNPYSYNQLWNRFHRILKKGIVEKFLTDEGRKKLPEIWKIEDERERNARLIGYLDLTKFNKLSQNAKTMLEKGLIPDGEITINEDGSIDSFTFSPIANNTTARLTRDNSEKRVFGYNTYYGRSPEDIKNNNYPGWRKDDITNQFSKFNISQSDGIKVSKLTREKQIEGKRNEGLVIEIDAANSSGYKKTLKFINDLKNDNQEITAYKIFNIGLKDSNQNFKEIFKALPENLPQLELVFETNNTEALIELENKKIDELSLYTTSNPLKDSWSLNPFSLKNVAWVNTIDYNVSRDYDKRIKVNSRIVFDSLSFENDDNLERINNGLRMAYFVRNNEPIFQGSLGPGLEPDHNENGNSYPMGLNLSRVKWAKSLKGMIFKDTKKGSNVNRKLRNLTLFNDSNVFEITTEELNNAQFSEIMITSFPQMPRTKIMFSNGNITSKIKIISNGISLNSAGLSNLKVLEDFSESIDFRKIYVNSDDQVIKNQLKTLGKTIEESNNFNWG